MRARRGQHLTEYALLLAVVATTLAGMQTYVRRGVQARLRSVSDIGRVAPQYEPYYVQAPGSNSGNNITTQSRSRVRTKGHYRITPDNITGNAVTEIEPQALEDGNVSSQVEWPPLP